MLQGRIEYRLHLDDCSTESSSGKNKKKNRSSNSKRLCQRRQGGAGEGFEEVVEGRLPTAVEVDSKNDAAAANNKEDDDETVVITSTSRTSQEQQQQQPWRMAGYYLYTTTTTTTTTSQTPASVDIVDTTPKEFLLSLPYAYYSMAQEVATTTMAPPPPPTTTTTTTASLSKSSSSPKKQQQQQQKQQQQPLYHVRILEYTIVPLVQKGVQLSSIALLQVHSMEKIISIPQQQHLLQQRLVVDDDDDDADHHPHPHQGEEEQQQLPTRLPLLPQQAREESIATTSNPIMTLTQVRRNEIRTMKQQQQQQCRSSSHEQLPSKSSSSSPRRQLYYTFSAIIDSISPIIAMDPSDPFALIELYDDDEDDDDDTNNEVKSHNNDVVVATMPNSCVVVLKGISALTWHAALLPGDRIILKQVIRKPWAILRTIMGHNDNNNKKNNHHHHHHHHVLEGRIPSHVFVVTDYNNLRLWKKKKKKKKDSSLVLSPMPLPPLPSTTIPLISIRGTIVQVEHIWLPSPAAAAAAAAAATTKAAGGGGEGCTSSSAKRKRTINDIPSHHHHQQQQHDELHHHHHHHHPHDATKISTLHWAEILSSSIPPIRYRLYLTHYPLSPALQICLAQPGTVIQAINIHVLHGVAEYLQQNTTATTTTTTTSTTQHDDDGKATTTTTTNGGDDIITVHVGACLRSTVTILEHADATTTTNDTVKKSTNDPQELSKNNNMRDQHEATTTTTMTMTTSTPTTTTNNNTILTLKPPPPPPPEPPSSSIIDFVVSVDGIMPYCFSKLRRTYREYILRRVVTQWLVASDCLSLMVSTTTTSSSTKRKTTRTTNHKESSSSGSGGGGSASSTMPDIVNHFATALFHQTSFPLQTKKKHKTGSLSFWGNCSGTTRVPVGQTENTNTDKKNVESCTNSTLSRRLRRRRRRNPYAEFFDHGTDDDNNNSSTLNLLDDDNYNQEEENLLDDSSEYDDVDTTQNVSSADNIIGDCGCDMSNSERQQDQQHPNKQEPCLIGLETIQSTGIKILTQRLEQFLFRNNSSTLLSGGSSSCSGPKVGWTGSIHMSSSELLTVLQPTHDVGKPPSLCRTLYTGGVVVKTNEPLLRDRHASVPFSLQDKDCQLPVSAIFGTNSQGSSIPNEERDFGTSELVLIRIETVIVSFLCFATAGGASSHRRGDDASEEKQRASQTEEVRLPPVESSGGTSYDCGGTSKCKPSNQALRGSCSVVGIANRLFVVSVQCRCSHITFRDSMGQVALRTSTSSSRIEECEQQAPVLFRTIQDCLEDPRATAARIMHSTSTESNRNSNLNFLRGILVRQRYMFTSVHANGKCKSCTLTLGHIPSTRQVSEEADAADFDQVSCAQSIDVKVSISCTADQRAVFQAALSQFSEASILDEQISLAVSWWNIADCIRSCALVAGGWEEWNGVKSALSTRQTAINIILPVSALNVAARGYVRLACNLDQLKASFTSLLDTGLTTVSCTSKGINSLDFVGGIRPIRQGTLDRRPRRRQVVFESSAFDDERIVGERYSTPWSKWRENGVATIKLIHLFHSLCMDLRDQSRRNLAPSLVRHLVGARFLGVIYCHAQCKCMRCYKPLSASPPSSSSLVHGSEKAKSKKGRKQVWQSRNTTIDEPSFWHLPHPMHYLSVAQAGGGAIDTTTSTPQQRQQPAGSASIKVPTVLRNNPTLRCSNNCPPECYTVSWECSGILDDGTGQAKLYASGDAALTLLGMTAQVIQSIEEGVWFHEDRVIRFQKAKPPPPYLKHAVQAALSKVRNPRHSTQQEQAHEALELLTPKARAEYVMQRHCRSSTRPQRDMEYLVRCKPLSDTTSGLNQTEAKIFIPRNGTGRVSIGTPATYSLPPLALDLVDCSVPSNF